MALFNDFRGVLKRYYSTLPVVNERSVNQTLSMNVQRSSITLPKFNVASLISTFQLNVLNYNVTSERLTFQDNFYILNVVYFPSTFGFNVSKSERLWLTFNVKNQRYKIKRYRPTLHSQLGTFQELTLQVNVQRSNLTFENITLPTGSQRWERTFVLSKLISKAQRSRTTFKKCAKQSHKALF